MRQWLDQIAAVAQSEGIGRLDRVNQRFKSLGRARIQILEAVDSKCQVAQAKHVGRLMIPVLFKVNFRFRGCLGSSARHPRGQNQSEEYESTTELHASSVQRVAAVMPCYYDLAL